MVDTTKLSPLNVQIGKNIAALRKKQKMTQEELAEELNISIKHCSSVERGKSCLSLEKLISVCNIFDVSLDYLVGGRDSSSSRSVPHFIVEMFHNASGETRENLISLMKAAQQLTASEDKEPESISEKKNSHNEYLRDTDSIKRVLFIVFCSIF